MPEPDSMLSAETRALLRRPVDLGPAARARVMRRVRAVAALRGLAPRSRGAVRPTVLGALLAASFVASLLTAGAREPGDNGASRSLADTIAVHFAAASIAARPMIDPDRIVAVADATRDLAPKRAIAPPARHD